MTSRAWLFAFASMASMVGGGQAFADQPAPAAVQNEPDATAAIIVTARRKEENLHDVPISITALSGTALVQRGITDALSLQTAIPSLTVTANGADNVSLSFDIRGQRTQEVQLLTDPPVGTYFDEVVMPRSFGFGNQFFDLQNVQVLKGVQGTLFGRNMTGGAVLVESAPPVFGKVSAEAVAQYGNYNLVDLYGMVNVPLGENFALRIDAKHHDRDGYTTDIASGRKYDDKKYDSFRASLAFRSGDFKNNLVFDYTREHENGSALKLTAYTLGLDPENGGVTTLAEQAGLSQVFSTAAGYPPQNLAAILASDLALPKYTVNYGAPNTGLAGTILDENPFVYVRNYGFTNKTTLSLGAVTLKNIFGYRSIDFQRASDYDGSSANLIFSDQYTVSQNFSEEFQAQGKALDNRLDFTLGSYYFSETGSDGSWSSQFPQLSSMGYAYNVPSLASYFLAQPASFFLNHQDAYAGAFSYAFYGAGNFAITPELKLSAGARYNDDIRKATITTTQPNFVFPLSAMVGLCSYSDNGNPFEYTVNDCAQSRRTSFSAATWDATLTYEPNRDLTLYVTTRHGYRAGGYNLRAENPAEFAPFLPETVQEFEGGLKTRTDFGGAMLTTSSAVFYQDYSNVQKQNPVLVDGTVGTVITNTAKEHIWGVEAEASLNFTGGFGLNAFTSLVHIDNILIPGVTDSGINPYEGTPKFQLGGAVTYNTALPDVGDMNFNLNARYQSATPLGAYDPADIQPAYVLVNARIELKKIGGTGFGVAVFANNLFDKYYMQGGISLLSNGPAGLSGGVGYDAAIFGEPRMYGVEVSYKF